MGFTDIFSDFYASLSFNELHAEAPPEEEEQDEGGDGEEGEGKGDDAEKSEDEGDSDGGENGGDENEGGDDEEEEEEEEEDEPEDIKPKLEAECAQSAQCAPLKHHYDDCAERVTKQNENPDHKGPKEDCVEEFFHLSHCAAQCAAPKLFRALK